MTRKSIFLTDARREVLEGTSDWEPSSINNEKSRIRKYSGQALSELVDVAESPEIRNRDVFDPEDVFRLLEALMHDPHEIYADAGPGVIASDDYSEAHRAYRDRLQTALLKLFLEEEADDR